MLDRHRRSAMNLLARSRQRLALLLSCCFVSIVFITTSLSGAVVGITDSLTHPPPATGSYAYDGFVLANAGGAIFVDPVFGSAIRRLTTDHQPDDIYAHNGMWNADATKYLHGGMVVDTVTGQVTHTVPRGAYTGDSSFDPINPNLYYYSSGSAIHRVTLNANGTTSDAVFYSASGTIDSLGQSMN